MLVVKMMQVMKRQRKRMTSRFKLILCAFFSLYSIQAFATLGIFPVTGLSLNTSAGDSTQGSLKFVPDAAETIPVFYKLADFSVNDKEVDKSKLLIKTFYTNGFESLDQYRPVLSGKENQLPLTAIIKFEPSWYDLPGTYTGLLIPGVNDADHNQLPSVPVSVVVNPISRLSLEPATFSIATSSMALPVISEVDLLFGTNRSLWSLYIKAENLVKQSGSEIESDRIYVRIKNVETPNTWLLLDRPLKIISGSATSIHNIATLEFFVDAKLADKSGEYTGQIKFFVQNY